MSSSEQKLEDLKITREEFDRITDALKQEEFRKLFVEYCEEISDPENRKQYEAEIKQLESQRGVECNFVHPNPGFVVKTTDGKEKVFINIAKNDLVDRPSYEHASDSSGKIGMNWSLPLIQAPVRKDVDKKDQFCSVYDVIFHPETLEIAERDSRFRQMVVHTALDAVTNAYKIELDKTNLRFPRMSYKGIAKPTVIRKKNEDVDQSTVDMGPLTDIMPPMPEEKPKIIMDHVKKQEEKLPEYTTPKYSIKYRKNLEMHEYTNQIDAKINSSIPSHMVIDINLPLLKSANDLILDVSHNKLSLSSESPAKYKLEVNLSYEVDEKEGNASFNKEKRILTVTLPILVRKIGVPDIEKERKPPIEVLSEKDFTENEVGQEPEAEIPAEISSIFDSSSIYETPDFHILSYHEAELQILFETPNIRPDSIKENVLDDNFELIFESIGEGYFPVFYGSCMNFDPFHILKHDFKISDEGMLILKLKFDAIVKDDQTFCYGAPNSEQNRYTVQEMHDPSKMEALKLRSIDQIEVIYPTPELIKFESESIFKIEE